MTKEPENADEGRRSFLKMAAMGAPAAAATAAGATVAEADTEVPQTSGLRKTAHVEAYLKSARF